MSSGTPGDISALASATLRCASVIPRSSRASTRSSSRRTTGAILTAGGPFWTTSVQGLSPAMTAARTTGKRIPTVTRPSRLAPAGLFLRPCRRSRIRPRIRPAQTMFRSRRSRDRRDRRRRLSRRRGCRSAGLLLPDNGQHWMAKRAAAHARRISGSPRRPTRWMSFSFGSGSMLSKFAAHRRGRPWAGPRGTSVGMSLTRVVTGATRIVVSRGRTELLVSTTTGRRLSPGTSANQTSPRSG